MTLLLSTACRKAAPGKAPPRELESSQLTHEYLQAELINGYVSGCLYEKPHYQMTFDKFTLKSWTPLKTPHTSPSLIKDSSDNEKTTDNNNTTPSVAADETFLPKDYNIESPEAELDENQETFLFPQGIKLVSFEGTTLEAEKGVLWVNENILYLEGHVKYVTSQWSIDFESLIINIDKESGRGVRPQLTIRNPSGALGLGRGSRLPAILKASSLILRPKVNVYLNETSEAKRVFEAQGGQARLGKTTIFNFPQKYSGNFDSYFAGSRAGKNSRYGVFLETKWRILNETFRLKNGTLKARLFGLENWYQTRGSGHGLKGHYRLNAGPTQAEGDLNFLIIDDQDEDRKQTEFTDNTRFFAHWIHRGRSRDGWQWNWEFSRESDEEVRDEFDRKSVRRDKPYQNRIFLARQTETQRISLLMQARAEEFIQEVDYLPRLQWDWIHQPIANKFILDGHLQFANARLNEAEAPHEDAPSIRAERVDFSNQLSYPHTFNKFILEPYLLSHLTWYSRQNIKRGDLTRRQSGVGIVLASRWNKGIYRFIPRVDAKRSFKPSARINHIPQIDDIDSRVAEETIEMNWRHLIRGSIAGNQRDLWDLDLRLTAFPNRHRDNEGDRWSLLSKTFSVIPHRSFEFFSNSKFDVRRRKYREFTGGFVIHPESRVDIGTSSSGREIFSGNVASQSQGHHQTSPWAFSLENRYIDGEPSRFTGQIDILPRDKWRVSYAQEWVFDGAPDLAIHRLKLNRDLHDWTLSFDWEVDSDDRSQSFSVEFSPHGWGAF